MSIRYCKKCKEIYEDVQSLCISDKYYCFNCKELLFYFGKEEAVLSVQDVIRDYDMLHPYSPVTDYKGIYKTYDSVFVDQSLLECEDVLGYDPTNKEALIYLSKHAWSKQISDKALDYMKLVYQTHELEPDVFYYYITVLLTNNVYEDVLESLERYKTRLDEFYVVHYRAIACLGLKQVSKALSGFYKSYMLCSEKERKQKIKTVIRRLTTLLVK